MGIRDDEAFTKYGLLSIEETINKASFYLLSRIMGDNKHLLIKRLDKCDRVGRSGAIYKPSSRTVSSGKSVPCSSFLILSRSNVALNVVGLRFLLFNSYDYFC